MNPVIIDNPIRNSPYREPTEHFRFDANNQITNIVDPGRRGASYFLPIAAPKKKAAPSLFDATEETKADIGHVNRIRHLVNQWRGLGWPSVTPMTRTLLEHWHAEDRFRRLFFCQIEAIETLIFIVEVAKQTTYGQDWIDAYLKEKAVEAGTELLRIACKMATGTGKTVVMSLVIAWQVLNNRQSPHDNRFTDAFLVIAPGITIRDRLRVLLPSDPGNYYKELDLVPVEHRAEIGTARIVIANFHGFKLREKGDAGGLTKRILTAKNPGAFTESPEDMVKGTTKGQRISFVRLDPFPGEYVNAEGETDAGAAARVSVGPEFDTLGDADIKKAALEAIKGGRCDLLLVCAFSFEASVHEQMAELTKEIKLGKLAILPVRMNPDLAMGDELLKKTGAANLFTVFGEPDVKIETKAGKVVVTIRGVDVFDPTTGAVRTDDTDDIACWFIDTDYDDQSFFVRHAYFLYGGKQTKEGPYDKLKKALRAEIDEAEWAKLYSATSQPFEVPKRKKIAVKVINHFGDEVLKVYSIR
jgi:Type III restriction enzyme, res subunit